MCFVADNQVWQKHLIVNPESLMQNFKIDTWNNSVTCCSSNIVRPTWNSASNVKVRDTVNLVVVPTRERTTSSSISSNFRPLYGSFRITVTPADVAGTSFGFFFFRTVYQEIDMEILSHENSKIRTAIQPIIRDTNGMANQLSHRSTNYTLNDTVDLRFDWFFSHVDFYINGNLVHNLTVNIPHSDGVIVVNHRSNANPRWSRGPPISDSTVKIHKMEYYYNVSDVKGCINQEESSHFNYIPIVVTASAIFFIILSIVLINFYLKLKKPVGIEFEAKNRSVTPPPIPLQQPTIVETKRHAVHFSEEDEIYEESLTPPHTQIQGRSA